MAQVVAYIPDLLFGSQVQGALRAGGHEAELVSRAEGFSDTLADADVLMFDLTHDALGRIGLFETLKGAGSLVGIRTLAFYSHVETETRAVAQAAGFELVVPRSRMAREAGALVAEATRRPRSQPE